MNTLFINKMTVVLQCSLHKNLIINSAIKCECGHHIKHTITIRRERLTQHR